LDVFFNNVEEVRKSGTGGKIDTEMEERESACLAALSTFSLPRMPLWPGTQRRVIGIGIVEKVVIRVRIDATRGCKKDGLEIMRKAARELKQIRMGL